jgi:hypothetical protein
MTPDSVDEICNGKQSRYALLCSHDHCGTFIRRVQQFVRRHQRIGLQNNHQLGSP